MDETLNFESVHTMLETSEVEHPLTLCHYPMMTFNHCMKAYMIHGHIHGNTNADHGLPLFFADPVDITICDIPTAPCPC